MAIIHHSHHHGGTFFATVAIASHTHPGVIAKERSSRPKQSPVWRGDGFAELTQNEANVLSMTGFG